MTPGNTGEDHAMAIVMETTIAARMADASDIAAEIGRLAGAELGDIAGVQVHLGVMESLTNIIRHGYRHAEDGRIAIRSESDVQGWSIAITDQGQPIPPDCLEAADGSVFDFDPDSLDEVPTGGMGLTLMRTVFDQVDYACLPEGNRLLLVRSRSPLGTAGGDAAGA